MKRCLHILLRDKLSGAEKMTLLMCKNMKEYEPIVVCGGEELKAVFEKNKIKAYVIDFSDKKIFKNIRNINNIINDENIEILHAHDNRASLQAYLVKKVYGLNIKVISHIHSCYPFLKENGIQKKIDSFFRKRYDHNIVCGKLVYDFYKQNTNYFLENRATILSNAIDIDEITNFDISKGEVLRKEFKIPKDKIILGFIGRICEIKGIIPFIKEFSKNKQYFNDCKILIIGSGDQEEEVKVLIKELELEDYFIFTGFKDNVYEFYPIIDIFFLPSIYEGLPMVLLEAMAFKKVVVSMDVGGISEVIKNNSTGCLIEEGNYCRFINSLKYIKENDDIKKGLEKCAYEYIRDNFNIRDYVKKIENLYKL